MNEYPQPGFLVIQGENRWRRHCVIGRITLKDHGVRVTVLTGEKKWYPDRFAAYLWPRSWITA